jgi:hypothetical protein
MRFVSASPCSERSEQLECTAPPEAFFWKYFQRVCQKTFLNSNGFGQQRRLREPSVHNIGHMSGQGSSLLLVGGIGANYVAYCFQEVGGTEGLFYRKQILVLQYAREELVANEP